MIMLKNKEDFLLSSNNGGNNSSADMENAVVPRPVQLGHNKKGINTVKKVKLN